MVNMIEEAMRMQRGPNPEDYLRKLRARNKQLKELQKMKRYENQLRKMNKLENRANQVEWERRKLLAKKAGSGVMNFIKASRKKIGDFEKSRMNADPIIGKKKSVYD